MYLIFFNYFFFAEDFGAPAHRNTKKLNNSADQYPQQTPKIDPSSQVPNDSPNNHGVDPMILDQLFKDQSPQQPPQLVPSSQYFKDQSPQKTLETVPSSQVPNGNLNKHIEEPLLLARLVKEMGNTLRHMNASKIEKYISRKQVGDGSSGGGTKAIKSVVAGVADGGTEMFFTPLSDRTSIPDIDDFHPVFDLPLPMTQHVVSLPPCEREDLLKRLENGEIMKIYEELEANGIPTAFEA